MDDIGDSIRDALETAYVGGGGTRRHALAVMEPSRVLLPTTVPRGKRGENRPADRSEDDLLEILEEMNHLKAFAHLSTSARAQLARVVRMERIAHNGDICA